MEQLQFMKAFGLAPKGIIHVGANVGQEFAAYRDSRASTVVYVEPVGRAFDILQRTVGQTSGHHAVKAVCTDRPGEAVTMNVASNSMTSSSILPLGAHADLYPEVTYVGEESLVSTTVDELLGDQFPDNPINLMVIDVQGAELKVLNGATETLQRLDAIYTEVSELPLYDGGCTWRQISEFLEPHGFHLKRMTIGRKHWGDAFFVKNSAIPAPPTTKIERHGVDLARGKQARQSSLSTWSTDDDAQGAVNGRVTGGFGFHTDLDDSPWWQVDLGGVVEVGELLVFNRLGNGQARAHDFVLRIGDSEDRLRQVHSQDGVAFGGFDGHPARIKLDGEMARFIRIELPHPGYLHLDAVEVYGVPQD